MDTCYLNYLSALDLLDLQLLRPLHLGLTENLFLAGNAGKWEAFKGIADVDSFHFSLINGVKFEVLSLAV
jgi:hypothetical protein